MISRDSEARARPQRAYLRKKFKTGQTLMKTILAPGFKARMFGWKGWFSHEHSRHRDGEVLEDPGHSRPRKNPSQRAGIHSPAGLVPAAVRKMFSTRCASTTTRHAATTKKAGTTSTSLAGSATKQIKVDFLCRDSILAAPIVLDLVLFLDLAQRAGMRGIPGVAQLLLSIRR